MDDKKRTKLQNRLKEIDDTLNNERDWNKIDSHSLIVERNEIEFKLNSENINLSLRDQRTKYYYASQCALFTNNLLKYGYNGLIIHPRKRSRKRVFVLISIQLILVIVNTAKT